jgi:hypothetical protein
MLRSNDMKTLLNSLLAALAFWSCTPVFAAPNPTNPAAAQLQALTPYTSTWSRRFLTNVSASDAIYFIMSDTNAVYSLVQAMGITNGDVNIIMDTNYVYGELARQSNAIKGISNNFALSSAVSNFALIFTNRTTNITAAQLDTNALVDGATIEFNSGGSLQVRGNGIGPWHFDPTTFALPLFCDGSNPVSLATNSITWEYLKTNLLYGANVASGLTPNYFFMVGTQASGTIPAQTIAMGAVSWNTIASAVTNIAESKATNAVNSAVSLLRPTLLSIKGSTSSVSNTPAGTNILRSYNVAMVVHTNDTGIYKLVFSNAFATTNYVVSVTTVGLGKDAANEVVGVGAMACTTTNMVLNMTDDVSTPMDPTKELHVIIFP